MTKFKPYSRREFWRLFRLWARRNLVVLAVAGLALAAILAIEVLVLVVVSTPTPLSWWLLGAVQVGATAAFAHLMHGLFLANEGRAITHLRGSWGEDNTRSELQRAKRRRLIWGWVDSIDLRNGDIDHLVVTRRGGLLVIDSKWRNSTSDVKDIALSARRTQLRAEAIARTVLTREGGARHRAKANPVPVTPLIVVWGAAQSSIPDDANVEGIPFVRGRGLVPWLGAQTGNDVSRDAAKDLVRRLERFRADASAGSAG